MSMIEVKELCFEYEEGLHTINHISFHIEQGSYTSILGHNGSGKSTIAKLLIGLLKPQSGSIKVSDIMLSSETVYEIRKKTGIVFQNPDNQFIGSTVRDDIAFGLENLCIDPLQMENIIQEYADKVNMTEFLDYEPIKLSGGQKQRVAIAGILAMNPELIILDESTSMLDPKGKREINELVRLLNNEKKMTILSITHDIEEAALSDQVILLSEGKIIKNGKPEELLTDIKVLQDLKLDIPFAYKISDALYHKGYPIVPTINRNELMKQLCQLHLEK